MRIGRHSLILGLSYALDIAGKNNLSHSKNTAYISILTARETGISENEALIIYYAALLHDIGVSTEYVLGISDYGKMQKHCVIGREILDKLPLPDEIRQYVYYHHEYFNGKGAFGLAGDAVPKGAQIIAFSSEFDDLFGKKLNLDRELHAKVSDWIEKIKPMFSPDITGAFAKLIEREFFLLDYFNYETKYALSDRLGIKDNMYYGTEDIKKFAVCFADIIDQKSPFTFNHSTGIAELARKAAAFLGYDQETQDKMYIAGLLHDIGKLHVLPSILHKNDKLSSEERFEINKHAYFTRKILERIQGFEDIVNLAANHHEKLDGTGYPYKMKGDQLSELEKVMAICDVFQALSEERPYRPKLPREKVWEIIGSMSDDQHLDKELAERLKQIL
jgi:putative nucleotidyltransferase with HDIG domain